MVLWGKQHKIQFLVQRVFLLQEFQAHDIPALQIDIGDEVIGPDPEFFVFPLDRLVRRYRVARFLPRRGRRLRRHAGIGHRSPRGPLLRALRDCLRWRTVLLLPGIPQEQKREGKHEKQNQTLRIHWVSGNWVITAGMPGVAACDALEREPTAVPGAVFVDRFRGIFRTGRKKAATWPEQRTQAVAISLDQEKQKLGHTRYTPSVLHQAANNFPISAPLGSPRCGLRARTR